MIAVIFEFTPADGRFTDYKELAEGSRAGFDGLGRTLLGSKSGKGAGIRG